MDEPMTGRQRSRLHTLAREAGVDVPSHLTQVQAAALIAELLEERKY